ncbi:PREDICTED: flexible cuticle protein 12-like [Nicrophorus vespilloides]|uniref:Flexible cuticle protein 12-like n=1 Tax=Nicrophorus vespilloides TaxID=110193 RepID=A0ABM1NIZ6_NICVS|nr:PREDICTED: flexible cuticle protein 12-like [Nicrophorus vespilloides]
MKFIVAFAALVAVALAAPQHPDKDAHVVKFDSENIGVEGFKYGYETSNGIAASEEGHVINAGTENEAIAVSGEFKYVGADGVTYTVTYIADENGFQPQGEHIPKADH